jgi:hypothetical protein
MKMKFLLLATWLMLSQAAFALSPYVHADRLAAGELPALMGQVEKKLIAEGFTPAGRYFPKGLPQHGAVVVTDPGLLQSIRTVGGSAVIASAIRVGVQSDGTVSYMLPEYWYRAYLRTQFPQAESAIRSIEARLTKALGGGTPFGGDVPVNALATYRYMAPMERFDSLNSELTTTSSFDSAVATVRNNLAANVSGTSKVYEVVMADKNIAVFGVAMDSPSRGERWWMSKLGPIGLEHIAGFPYEIYIVGNKIHALYGRYRIALAYPSLSLGQFMAIRYAPEEILNALSRVAGASEVKLDN